MGEATDDLLAEEERLAFLEAVKDEPRRPESLSEALDLIDEMRASADLRWKADMRAIERWHAAGNPELVWPDHTDLVVWLLEQGHTEVTRAPHPSDPHRFVTRCVVCGTEGRLTLTVHADDERVVVES